MFQDWEDAGMKPGMELQGLQFQQSVVLALPPAGQPSKTEKNRRSHRC